MSNDFEQSYLFENVDATEETGQVDLTVDDFSQLIIAPSDWTIETLYSQIGKQIDLDPAFQRRGVWNTVAKSRFIESIFLGIPIPQILFSSKQGSKGAFLVLDGKQRLITIKEFLDGKHDDGKVFKLKELRVLKELNGKSWADISKDEDWKYRLLNETQRTAIIRGWENEQVLYEIFFRLNSGSVKLSPMELRMSLHPGEFLKFIIRWTERVGPLHELLNKRVPDPRMADVELAIRYLAFSDPEITYQGDLKKYLDDICLLYNDKFRNDPEFQETIASKLDGMDAAIETGFAVFDKSNFGHKFIEDSYERRFNRAVFDVQVGSLSFPAVRDFALANRDIFRNAFETVSKDPNFQRAVETTTKSVLSTKTRFEKWYSTITEISGLELNVPNIEHEDAN
ncbi:DUF262 domain-containing protein [Brucella intermedia]|uniref:DUF262 domain-containing protein n=1 Tax=Brucella intermedia TaxID=94625 RepID=UPI000EFD2DFE|nr:DUF262 domain-containing protein [Brucella intermedia]KAB2720395.1 DUF262 domain-containing protein [Brucella intermedia]